MLLWHRREHRRDQSRRAYRSGNRDRCTDGILFVRHRGRAATLSFGRFPNFGLSEQRHVAADLPERAACDTQRTREVRQTIAVCMPGYSRCAQPESRCESLRHSGRMFAKRCEGTGRAAELEDARLIERVS
jgi:hypothetical protein